MATDGDEDLDSTMSFKELQEDGSFDYIEFPQLNDLSQFPRMSRAVEGKNYACYNLEGIQLDDENEEIQIRFASNLSVDFYTELLDISQVLEEQ